MAELPLFYSSLIFIIKCLSFRSQGSVEFIESNEFRIEVNVTSPSIAELARVHYNYTDYHGSVLLQLVSMNNVKSILVCACLCVTHIPASFIFCWKKMV